MGEHLSTLSGSRMRENRPSGLTSGEWKRNAWRAIQAPATERAGLSYARLPITAPLLDSTPCGGTIHPRDRQAVWRRNWLAPGS
jgi:hypothetical protein